ncbi:hypothetical protein COCNU_scaffold006362G000070 [Cocos nucifera]|nr:hypothetical protein [Cocos nucifera]
MGHAWADRGHGSAKHGCRGGKEGEQNVGSAPEGGPGPCVRGAPYHPDGACGQAPPQGFRRTERHCKWAGDGMRVPWAWRSGLARRGPESLAAPPLRMPGRGRQAHAWSDRGQGSSAQGRRIAEVRCRTSAGHPREELGRATDSTPTTPTGHPGKSNPGGSKGPSGIANGRVPGCASHGHGDRDLCSGVPNPMPDRPRAAVAPPNTPTGHPDNPNPGGSKGWSGIANGWGTGCASHGHGARDLHGGDPNPWPPLRCARPGMADRPTHGPTEGWEDRRRADALRRSGAERPQGARGRSSVVRQRRPLPPRWGIPASPTPGVPKDRAALQTGGSRDARPVGMAIGTCAAGS